MLTHLRVLDLTDGGASVAGRILSDLGAEVILVEPPAGLASRRLGPFVDDVDDPERSLEFWTHHRGKRSLVLDLDTAEGLAGLSALVQTADACIEDGSLGDLDTLLAPETLARRAPQLIHVRISPFGQIGPKSDWAATDLTVTAASVALWLTGDADLAPLTCGVPQAFLHAGAEASTALLIALVERERSGLGQHIDVSAQTAMMASTQSAVLTHGWGASPLGRTGGGVLAGGFRIRFIYECADGYVNLTFLFGEPIGHATARFFDWMDEEGFSTDAIRQEDWVGYAAKFMSGGTTVEAHELILEAIERFTRTKTKAEFLEAAFERKLLIVPLNDMRDLIESEQLRARAFWRPLQHPRADRPILHPGPFARLSHTPIRAERPAPLLGELALSSALDARAGHASAREEAPSDEPEIARTPRALPLAGLKVLDFSWVYAGPAITRQLAEYGATVVKIESAKAPDALRGNQPFKDDRPGVNRSANFSNVNLGKLSLGLDMKTPEGRAIALRLVDWADVVVENFSPRAMQSWGLDWPVLQERKPALVMLSSSLAGASGPHRLLAGYGTMGSALAGFGVLTGWPNRRPSAPYLAYTDYIAPRFALTTLLAAWGHARRTGIGQHIDLSQAEASLHFLGAPLLDYTANGRLPEARGNAHPHYAPSGVYPALGEDRWIAIAAPDDTTFSALSNIAGSDWASDPRFATPSARRAHLEALDSAIADWTRDQSAESLESALQARGVPAHRVHDSRDAFEDPQLVARNHFVPVEYADLGPLPYEGPRARLSTTPGRLTPCPTPGEHNPFVLRDLLGLDEDEITELVIAGAIE